MLKHKFSNIITKLQKLTLIQKDIKKHTDWGEEYNRESFYDTIEECLMNGDTLLIDSNNHSDDKDARFLRYMRLEQLNAEMCQNNQEFNGDMLEQYVNDLIKY